MDIKLEEAIQKAIEEQKDRNFKQSVELAINLRNVDMNNPKNRVNEEILLPYGMGKPRKIAVFAGGELGLKAKEYADIVISPEEMDKFEKKEFKKVASEVDFFLADIQLMTMIGKKFGVVLGPRGKMPKPIPPNMDVSSMISRLRNTIIVRSKTSKTLHAHIGVEDMALEELTENATAVLKRMNSKLEHGRDDIASAYVTTTMGKGIKFEVPKNF